MKKELHTFAKGDHVIVSAKFSNNNANVFHGKRGQVMDQLSDSTEAYVLLEGDMKPIPFPISDLRPCLSPEEEEADDLVIITVMNHPDVAGILPPGWKNNPPLDSYKVYRELINRDRDSLPVMT